jgi:flagellar protein FliS
MSWRDAYLENQVLNADPLELVRMLYQAALDSVKDARAHLTAGDIRARSNSITRAQAIIGELNGSLDHKAAPEISRNLASLYSYMRQRLTEANLKQKDAPLAETEGLLATMYDAWQKMSAPEPEPTGMAVPAGPVREWAAYSSEEAHTWSA